MSTHYQRAKEIFLMVCDRPFADRARIIDRECAGDHALRTEVLSLLAHHDAGEGSESPKRFEDDETAPRAASKSNSSFRVETGSPQPTPDRIGHYKVIRRIGSGGMGMVYLAARDDDQFKKRVAIKVIKKGMDSEEILRRFEQERQVLSALNHPNIARMLDGGSTDDGRPYFVMEYIEGMPISEYCDKNRLRIEERLQLFRTLCHAIHHAHANLIVHRDIKPTNVVVTADGTLKLLDFGIAKLLNPDFSAYASEPTATSLRLMTPEYASPEQVRGDPISTASDVYSLGVLLYELVTGRRPYRFKTRLQSEIERIICTEDPERPSTAITHLPPDEDPKVATPASPGMAGTSTPASTVEEIAKLREARPDRLRRRLSGDIDNIVLMAMRKEPRRRYTSAEQFGDDIRRHLDGLPVIARPMTLGYRVSKFVLRNRAGVAAAATIAILLVGWAVMATVLTQRARAAEQQATAQALIATQEREKAIQARDGSLRMQRFISEAFDLMIVELGKPTSESPTLNEYRSRTENRVNLAKLATTFVGEVSNLADVTPNSRDLARAYMRLGELQGGVRGQNLGDRKRALENFTIALDALKKEFRTHPDDPEIQHMLIVAHIRCGDTIPRADTAARMAHYESAKQLCEQLINKNANDREAQKNLAIVQVAVCDMLSLAGQLDEAEKALTQARTIRERFRAEAPDDLTARREAGIIHVRMGELRSDQNRYADAQEHFDQLIDIRHSLYKLEPTKLQQRRDLALAYWWSGRNLLQLNRWREARERLEAGRALAVELQAEDPGDGRARADLAYILAALGDVAVQERADPEIAENEAAQLRLGQLVKQFYSEAELLLEATAANNPLHAQVLADLFANWGNVEVALNDHAGARNHFSKARHLYQQLATSDPRYKSNVETIEKSILGLTDASAPVQ